MRGELHYTASTHFEAARRLDTAPTGHRTRNLHGHGFTVRVRATLPPTEASIPGAESDLLQQELARCVSPLDYVLLNEKIALPSDENVARWIRDRLDVPGVETVGVKSTPDQGIDLDEANTGHIWRRFRFEAAHRLPFAPAGHQCARMHGHGFEVVIHARHAPENGGTGIDFDQLTRCWAPLHRQLNHVCLNDIPGLENPTSELIAVWIWTRLTRHVPQLSWVTVYETVTAGCHFDGIRHRIWKEQRFESALRLQSAPDGDSRRRLHGHSYQIRLHLTAPLDPVAGWTVDFGIVRDRFAPLYRQLDHQSLDSVAELAEADSASLLHWIRECLAGALPQLERIDLFHTPGCGAILSWGETGPALPG
jgi:6-pyruvoyltetrahydropterin/6-carboxytetrahydropterin synthase